MFKRQKGSALIDYMLPTALIGIVVGLGLYYMFSENLFTKFITASANMKVDLAKGQAVIGHFKEDSSSLVYYDTPTQSCTEGTCIIDFGPFPLTGLPENFSEFIETSGSAGATDKLFAIAEQIADYLKDTGDLEGAKEFRELANLGHFMSDIQETVEDELKSCQSESDVVACFDNKYNDNSIDIALPANLNDVLPNYYDCSNLRSALSFTLTDYAMNGYYDSGIEYQKT
ncbi:MAG: hypothetical protein U9N08_07425, partial [Candidatus Caldatribacteriota bacterium]|nr:hypothetical protein [Candidatus Caldatribacteriota bacterium]